MSKLVALWAAMAVSAAEAPEPSATTYRTPLIRGSSTADDAWRGARQRLAEGDNVAARVLLERLQVASDGAALLGLHGPALVVLDAARRAVTAGKPHEALDLATIATHLAPNSSEVAFTSAAVRWESGGFSELNGAVSDVTTGLGRLGRDATGQVALLGRASGALQLALCLAMVLFGLVMLFRHSGRLAHDTGHFLPAAVRGPPLLVVGAVVVLVLPLAVGMGLVLMSLVWLAMLWPYTTLRERIVGAVLATLVALTPIWNRLYGSALAYPTSRIAAAQQCLTDLCLERLQDRAMAPSDTASGVLSADEHLALGLARYHEGATVEGPLLVLSDAVRHFKGALEHTPDAYAAQLGLANAMYTRANRECQARGESRQPTLDAALQAYDRAFTLSESPTEAAYNRSVLLRQLGKVEDAEKALDQAKMSDLARVMAFRETVTKGATAPTEPGCPPRFDGARLLMDAWPSVGSVVLRGLDLEDGKGPVLVPLGQLLAGIAPASYFPLVGTLCAVVLILGAWLVRLMRPAHECSQCGRVACGRCRRELREIDLCERCLFIRIKGAFVDSRDKWLRDRGLRESKARRDRTTQILSMLVPGLGHLLRGKTASGTALLVSFVWSAVLAVVGSTLLPESGPTRVDAGTILSTLAFGVALLLWAGAFISALVRRS